VRASFAAPRTRVEEASLRAIARSLGATVVPLCVRELPGPPPRRAWALDLLRAVAQVADERVRIALREFAGRAGHDEATLAALALLAELGDEATAGRFDDPHQMHQQSLARFAHQLVSPAEIASAADLLVSRLAPDELVEFVEAFSEADPDRACALGDELAARVDLDVNARGELSRVTAPLRMATPADRPRRPARALGRPALLAGLRHPDGRVVIAVARRVTGESRWRSLAVLCGADGQLDSVRYADDTTPREVREAISRRSGRRLPAVCADRDRGPAADRRRRPLRGDQRQVAAVAVLPRPRSAGSPTATSPPAPIAIARRSWGARSICWPAAHPSAPARCWRTARRCHPTIPTPRPTSGCACCASATSRRRSPR
jgi:hypothetical protein